LNNDSLGEMPINLTLKSGDFLRWSSVLHVLNNYETSSVGWNLNMNMGGKLLPKLNICETPIVNKYFEGKLKNTLVRG